MPVSNPVVRVQHFIVIYSRRRYAKFFNSTSAVEIKSTANILILDVFILPLKLNGLSKTITLLTFINLSILKRQLSTDIIKKVLFN